MSDLNNEWTIQHYIFYKNPNAYMYWRLVKCPNEGGISPLKWLLERSRVWRFKSLPISLGTGPLMLLFCRSLQTTSFLNKREQSKLIHSSHIHTYIHTYIHTHHQSWSTYTILRFVRFPILGESVPDKFWLGVPLQLNNP